MTVSYPEVSACLNHHKVFFLFFLIKATHDIVLMYERSAFNYLIGEAFAHIRLSQQPWATANRKEAPVTDVTGLLPEGALLPDLPPHCDNCKRYHTYCSNEDQTVRALCPSLCTGKESNSWTQTRRDGHYVRSAQTEWKIWTRPKRQ